MRWVRLRRKLVSIGAIVMGAVSNVSSEGMSIFLVRAAKIRTGLLIVVRIELRTEVAAWWSFNAALRWLLGLLLGRLLRWLLRWLLIRLLSLLWARTCPIAKCLLLLLWLTLLRIYDDCQVF